MLLALTHPTDSAKAGRHQDDSSPLVGAFCNRLQEWYHWATHSRLEPMIQAACAIKKHWDGIVRWGESYINNGILEGLNSIIQAAKRKARGYKNKHLKTMSYLLTGKLDLHRFNPHLPTHFL
jgi:hypothetical protein